MLRIRNISDRLAAIVLLAGLAAVMTVRGPLPASASDAATALAKLEADVARDYPGVAHISAEEFEQTLAASPGVLLIDARADGEIAVSRLPGAIAVDPDISADEFVDRFADAARGHDVVIYCSVGVRSSRLATRVRDAMTARGAVRVVNLKGGIFALHNARRKLVDKLGDTEWVHPYSWWWSRYLERRELTRYEPRPRADKGRGAGTDPVTK